MLNLSKMLRCALPVLPALAVAALVSFGPAARPAAAQAAVSVTKSGSPDPVFAGANLTYTITVGNATGVDLEDAAFTDTLPAGTTFVSLAAPPGWACSTPAAGGVGTVSCSLAPVPAGDAVFTLVVQTSPGLADGSSIVNQVDLTATSGGRSTTVSAAATTLVLSPPPVVTVPALGTFGLAALALLLAAAGFRGLRRAGV